MKDLSVQSAIFALVTAFAAMPTWSADQVGNGAVGKSAIVIDCPSLASIKNSDNPVELYAGMRACINAEQYETAIVLFGLAGVYGRFDMERVQDTSAHQAVVILRRGALDTSDLARKNEFQRRAGEVYDNESARNQLCAQIENVGPPTYIPRYMLAHGLAAKINPAKTERSQNPQFDPVRSWLRVKSSYLKCQ